MPFITMLPLPPIVADATSVPSGRSLYTMPIESP